ncbi:MAG: hypothetical protein COY42_31235 [Armatimonadetes bacterium CG_4_10_14_0_8_um_filter_66_14]|nr:sugar phosphate isomerase/epimerase [Armatimonadota bacterium]PIZ32427.1 MAG: hypothetical protein COY42_31235 [Armatimonadetes bacterium CG_4_10_14_0_8_um_filter_66_14]PJB74560.1 MAG: hypothetical protein CO096_03400 [Armatimonadetes bacterium CG_4_9_14_3_um_filter_66_14]
MEAAMCTSFDHTIPFAQVVPLIRQAGFGVVSIGARPRHSDYDTAEGRAAIKQLTGENRLTVDSVHAPFPEGDRLFSLVESERLESVRQCKLAIEAAAYLEGRIVVVHLIPDGIEDRGTEAEMIGRGRLSVGELAECAADRGVRLALENGQTPAYDRVLELLLTEFEGDPVGFCYDSGHENVKGTCFGLLEKFGDRLLSVHLHDNLGSDTHLLPYEGNIDWDRFREAFHGLGYSGSLLLEPDMTNSQFKEPAVFLSEARQRAERLLQCPLDT